MDTKRACQILNIHEPFQEQDLKRAWRAAARKYHPDKNSAPESETRFLEAQEAYAFLSMYGGDGSNDSLLRNVMDIVTGGEMADTCRFLTLDIFRRLDRAKAIRFLCYMEQYAALFQFEDEIIDEMRAILEEDSETVVIRPTIDNLLRSDIYCLEHGGATYYIPMWHDEMTYDRLIVRCAPELPPHMLLDEKSTLHVTIKATPAKVFETGGIEFFVGEISFFVDGEKLRLVKRQTHVFEGKGVPRINHMDAFDNNRKGDVILHLELIV